jgi:hypothetical protein
MGLHGPVVAAIGPFRNPALTARYFSARFLFACQGSFDCYPSPLPCSKRAGIGGLLAFRKLHINNPKSKRKTYFSRGASPRALNNHEHTNDT